MIMTNCSVSIDELNHDLNSEELATKPLPFADFLHDDEWEDMAIQALISHSGFERALINFARGRLRIAACVEFSQWIEQVAGEAADDIEVEV